MKSWFEGIFLTDLDCSNLHVANVSALQKVVTENYTIWFNTSIYRFQHGNLVVILSRCYHGSFFESSKTLVDLPRDSGLILHYISQLWWLTISFSRYTMSRIIVIKYRSRYSQLLQKTRPRDIQTTKSKLSWCVPNEWIHRMPWPALKERHELHYTY